VSRLDSSPYRRALSTVIALSPAPRSGFPERPAVV